MKMSQKRTKASLKPQGVDHCTCSCPGWGGGHDANLEKISPGPRQKGNLRKNSKIAWHWCQKINIQEPFLLHFPLTKHMISLFKCYKLSGAIFFALAHQLKTNICHFFWDCPEAAVQVLAPTLYHCPPHRMLMVHSLFENISSHLSLLFVAFKRNMFHVKSCQISCVKNQMRNDGMPNYLDRSLPILFTATNGLTQNLRKYFWVS